MEVKKICNFRLTLYEHSSTQNWIKMIYRLNAAAHCFGINVDNNLEFSRVSESPSGIYIFIVCIAKCETTGVKRMKKKIGVSSARRNNLRAANENESRIHGPRPVPHALQLPKGIRISIYIYTHRDEMWRSKNTGKGTKFLEKYSSSRNVNVVMKIINNRWKSIICNYSVEDGQ